LTRPPVFPILTKRSLHDGLVTFLACDVLARNGGSGVALRSDTGTNTKTSRKERERLVRKRDIMRAARELFATKGFHDTSLDDIAREAEFGKGTIYNYFSSKEDLFFAIIEDVLEGVHAVAESAVRNTEGHAREKLAAYASGLVSYCREHCDLLRVISRGVPHIHSKEHAARVSEMRRMNNRTLKTLARPIAQDMRDGRLRAVEAEQVALLFDGALHFFLMRRVNEEGTVDSRRLNEGVSLLTTLFFDGLERK